MTVSVSEEIESAFREAIAKEVMHTRKMFGWSRRELADAFGVTEITVSRWETGARSVPSNTLLVLRSARTKYLDAGGKGRASPSIMHVTLEA